MTTIKSVIRKSVFAAVAGILAASAGPAARAQDPTITPTAADDAAALAATGTTLHALPANTPAAAGLEKQAISPAGPTTTPFQSGKPRYPGDLSYQGGPFVDHAQSHAIYVKNTAIGCTTPACWGNPEAFLQDVGKSDFIHITDQYVNRRDDNRYTNGSSASICFLPGCKPPAGLTLTDATMRAVVHAVVSQTHQAGLNHIYHVFLPPGTDECFTSALTTCYSPDKPSTFAFCAYHSSVHFLDFGEVLYTVEPFQNVSGCDLAPGSPNGPVVDATANVLSHELFETITDPTGRAWWNTASNSLFGSEIGDECSFIIFLPKGVFFDPPAFKIGEKKYAVQSEYDNSNHGCTTRTGEGDGGGDQ